MANFGSFFYKPKSRDKEISAKRWNIFSIIGKAIRKTCTAIGAMVLFSIIMSTILVMTLSGKAHTPLPDDMVLVLKLEEGITEIQAKPTFMEPFPFNQPTLSNIVNALEKARDDKRVRGVVFSLKSGGMSIAQVQELRIAMAKFRESGKFTKIYASSYADGSGGLGQYYLASAFDEIWMQPVGMLSISGMNMEMPFARKALDKIGVSPQFLQREEYKSAMENLTNSEISPANEEAMESLIGNLSARMMSDISSDRKINMVTLAQQIDKGILTGDEAVKANLIDRLDYADVMISEMRKDITGNPDDESLELVAFGKYAQSVQKNEKEGTSEIPKHSKSDVALIYAVGTIVDTAGAGGNAGADVLYAAITEATEDNKVKAIVLRVDSPGGSPAASETIRRALVKAKEKGKKVVVSMGSVAASGGYWISADADAIFANSGTITGSIGVVMGKFEASALWKKLGINWQGPQMGANADIWSINAPFDEQARERMNVLIDDVYDAFLTRVATGRKMTKAEVREVAKGRPWTGEQAKLAGLVDQIGGLNEALDHTATLLEKTDRKELNIIRMPKEKNPFEAFLEMFGASVSLGNFLGLDNVTMRKLNALFMQAKLQNDNTTVIYDANLEALR